MQAAATKAFAGSGADLDQFERRMNSARTSLNNLTKSYGDVEVRTMRSVSAAETYTKRIQEQKVHIGEAIRQRKLMNQVINDQINLQNMQVASWSKNKEGKIISDIYIPDTAVKSIDRTRVKLGMYNELLKSVADNTVKWGKNTQWAGRQLTVGFTVPLAMAAAATGKLAYDMDKALTQITKVYGDATQQFQETAEDIRAASLNTAKNMASMYGQSAKDTLEITAQFAAAGATGVELQQATAAATKARMLNEIDLQTAIEASIAMQTVYQMSGEELGQTWDYINAVANQTILSAEDFAIAIPKVGGLLKSLGADAKDVGVLMTAMVAGGIDAAEGANALKSIAFRAVAPYDKAVKTFKESTGANLKELSQQANGQIIPLIELMIDHMGNLDTVAKTQVFKDVFGIHQGNKALILMEQMANKSGQVAQALAVGDNSVAENALIANQELERMNAQPYKRIQKAFEEIKISLAEIGKVVLPPLASALEFLSEMFGNIEGMSSAKKTLIIIAAAAIGLAGPILMLIGLFGNLVGQGFKMIGMLGTLTLNFKGLTPEQKAQEILARNAARSYDVQGSAAARLTQNMMSLTDAIAANNGIMGRAFATPGDYRKNKPTDAPLVYGADYQGTTQQRGPNGRFMPGSARRYNDADGNATLTAAQAKKAYAESVLAAHAVHQQNMVDAARNKLLEEQRQRYAGVAMKMGGVLTMGAGLVSMFGPENGAIAGIAKIATGLGMVAFMFPGLIAKGAMWTGSFIAGNALIQKSIVATRGAMTALMAQLSAAALPLAAAAAAVGFAWYKAGQEAEEATNKMKATINSTEGWSEMLGYNRIDPGTFATQNAKTSQDITASAVSQLKTKAPDLYNVLDAKDGAKIGEKWGAAIAQGAQVALSGGSEDAAIEAVKTAMAVMNSGLSNVEIESQLDIDFTNLGEVARARVDELGRMLEASIPSTGDGRWDKILRTLGPDAYQLTDSAKKLVADSTVAFNEALIQTPVEDRAALIDSYVSNLVDPLEQAYQKAGKKMGVSREEFFKMLRDHNEKGGLAIGTATLAKEFSNAEIQALSRQMQAYDETAVGLADLNDMSDDIINGKNLPEVAKRLKEMANNAQLIDGKAAAKEIDEIAESVGDLDAVLKTLNIEISADDATNRYKEVMQGVQNAMYDVASRAYDQQTEDISGSFDRDSDRVQAEYERKTKALEALQDAANDRLEARQEAAQNRQEAMQEAASNRLEKTQERRRDAVEAYYDSRIAKIDAAIEAEQKAEEMRERLFEAEQERIRRYSQMFSQNVDLNAAITTGDFDAAAKIANDMQAQETQWGIEDQQVGAGDATKASIERLEGQKTALDRAKEARLKALTETEKLEDEALKRRQKAEDDALNKRFERERKMLQHTQRIESERLAAAEKSELAKIEASKNSTLRRREEEKRMLDIELAELKAFLPKDEAQMEGHKARLAAIYTKYGLDLTKQGKGWSNVIGTTLASEVKKSSLAIASDKQWKTVGSDIATALLKGAFGMTPAQMGAWMNGGAAPSGSIFSSAYKPGTTTAKAHLDGYGSGVTRHKGGIIDSSRGSRAGHSGNTLNPSEVNLTALKGESVLNRKATDLLGAEGVDALNEGGLPPNTGPWGPTSGFAGLAGAMTGAITKRLMMNTISAIKTRIMSGQVGDYAGAAGKYAGVNLTPEQIRNAGIIMKTGKSMGASSRDLQIALMTAMQESTLRNIAYGDRDSVGLFQQRPSQGWGSVDQIMNPEYASRKFFSSLFNVKNRNDMPMTLAAQAVQRSAFPMAYAKWENLARALLMGGTEYKGFGAGIDISNLMGLMGQVPPGLGGWVRPARGRVSSEYGMRNGRLHDGIDIANASGTPLYAARAGVVTQTRFGSGVGNYTQIDHGNGVQTGYAHQLGHGVRVGQMVQAGQQIGLMGNTGRSTGPHLHFRYYKNGTTQNPRTIMPQLAQGGYTLTSGLANLHPKETVLTKPLSADLKEGISKFSDTGGGGDTFKVTVDLTGAYISSEVIIERAVNTAIEKAERKKGRSRTIGNR